MDLMSNDLVVGALVTLGVLVMGAISGALVLADDTAKARDRDVPGTRQHWYHNTPDGRAWHRIANRARSSNGTAESFAQVMSHEGWTPLAVERLLTGSRSWTTDKGWERHYRPEGWVEWEKRSSLNTWRSLVGKDDSLVRACLTVGFTRKEVQALIASGEFEPTSVRTLAALMV